MREKYNVLTFCSYGSSKGVIFTPSANRIIHLLKVPYVPPGGPVERGYTTPEHNQFTVIFLYSHNAQGIKPYRTPVNIIEKCMLFIRILINLLINSTKGLFFTLFFIPSFCYLSNRFMSALYCLLISNSSIKEA